MSLLLPLQLGSVIFALFELAQLKYDKWTLTSSAGVAVFFLSALLAHRRLYLSRPKARDLTEFYLWMSFGGVLGGLFSALVAPKLFSEIFEYPLLIALTVACRPGVFKPRTASRREMLWLLAIVAIGLLPALYGEGWAARLGLSFGDWGSTAALTLALGIVMIGFWGQGARQLAVALVMFATVVMLPSTVKRGNAQRSYFGVYRVSQSESGDFNVLTHGTTLHGAQRIRDEDGKLVTDTTPGTYYYPGSPLARSVEIVQGRLAATGERANSASSGSAPAPSPATPRRTSAGASSRSIPSSSTLRPSRTTSPFSPTACLSSTWSWATRASPWRRSPTAASTSFSSMPSPPTLYPCT